MSFRFPTDLSNDDIQQCLSDMQINLDPSQLIKPTPEAVRTYYEQAVIALMDTSREELARPDFAALTGMEYMELHDESIPFLNFLQKLTKLMQFCGITDFTLNDIFKPEPARLRRHFCAMINFARYREEKVTNLDMLQNRLAEMMRLEHSEMERKEKNLAELKRLKERRAARQQEAAAVEMDTQAITAKIMQHNKVHTVLAEETRGIKAQTNALTDQAAELKLMLNSLYDKCSALQDELVHSPEKHKTVINDLCAAYDKKRDYHAGLSSLRAEHERKLDMLTKFEKDLQRCVTAVEEVEAAVAKKKSVGASTKENMKAIADQERQHDDLLTMHASEKRKGASLLDKISRTEQQGKVRVDLAAAEVEKQTSRRESVKAERAADHARAEEQEARMRHWRERTDELLAAKESRVKEIMDRYNKLRRTVAEYNRRLDEAIASNSDPEMMMSWMAGAASADAVAAVDVGSARDKSTLYAGVAPSAAMQRLSLA